MDPEDGASERLAERQARYKAAISTEDARRRRAAHSVKLREDKKEMQIHKRRNAAANAETDRSSIVPLSAPTITGIAADASGMAAPVPTKEMLPHFAALMRSPSDQEQLEGAAGFRRLLSMERHPPVDFILSLGVVPLFVHMLTREDSPRLQFEAAWALTNIASGTAEHTRAVMESGAVPAFVALLASPAEDVREQAVWALGNVAGDSTFCRDEVLKYDVMPGLLGNIRHDVKHGFLRNCTWTLSNLCRGKPLPDFNKVKVALPYLAKLIYGNDPEILMDALWALSYLSDGNYEVVQAVVEAGVVGGVVSMLQHASPPIHTPALRTVGNIVTGDEIQTQLVINAGALPALCTMLATGKNGIKKEACWAVSNIMAGSRDQVGAVIAQNIIPVLLDIMRKGHPTVQKEAVWAISNATTHGTPDQIEYFVNNGVLSLMREMLTEHISDARVVTVGMEGVENILKAGLRKYGDDRWTMVAERADVHIVLEDIQEFYQDSNICVKAATIIQTYFQVEEEEGQLDATGHYGIPALAQASGAPAIWPSGAQPIDARLGIGAGHVPAPPSLTQAPPGMAGWGGSAPPPPPHLFNFQPPS